MLSDNEKTGLQQLLSSPDPSALGLGLEILRPHKPLYEHFLPLLIAQKILLSQDAAPPAVLLEFLQSGFDAEKVYAWEQNLRLLHYAAHPLAKGELAAFKRGKADLYERSKAEFLGCFELLQPLLTQSGQFEHIFGCLAYHFMYKDNDYLLATEYVFLLYQRAENYQTMAMLLLLLAYYHFPNGRLLFLFPKIQKWIEQFYQDASQDDFRQLYIHWAEGLLWAGQGRKDKAADCFLQTLQWAASRPKLNRAQSGIFADIYQHLSIWAAEAGQGYEAELYLQKTLNCIEEAAAVGARAAFFRLQNQPQQAIKTLKQGIKRRPVTEIYYMWLADVYLSRKKPEEAIATLIACVDNSPQYLLNSQKLLGLLRLYPYPEKQELIVQYQRLEAEIKEELDEIERLFASN